MGYSSTPPLGKSRQLGLRSIVLLVLLVLAPPLPPLPVELRGMPLMPVGMLLPVRLAVQEAHSLLPKPKLSHVSENPNGKRSSVFL